MHPQEVIPVHSLNQASDMEHTHNACHPFNVSDTKNKDDDFLIGDQPLNIDRTDCTDRLAHLVVYILDMLTIVNWMDSSQNPKPPRDSRIQRHSIDVTNT